MVVFVDLDDESEPPEGIRLNSHWEHNGYNIRHGRFGVGNVKDEKDKKPETAQTKTMDKKTRTAVAEAFGCYPIAISIASHIDLNTLDALARTCHQVRVNLLQYQKQLLSSTLHCENEDVELNPEHTFRYRARAADWYFVEMGREAGGTTGKAGDCARDMNCTIKAPAPVLLRHRHRRLCTACSRVPLSTLVSPAVACAYNRPSGSAPHIKAETIERAVCKCATEGVWLCQPCGRSLRSADSEYEGIWKWRTRYLPSLGGLGVGIGEGDRGVPCGRGEECVAARDVESEIDCDAEDAREIDHISRASSASSSPSSSTSSIISKRSGQIGPGYARHEIEGIGGRLKKKLVRMVKVGACVPEWSDEEQQGEFLAREIDGQARSWCGWCWRAVPGAKDKIN
ncbi:hypothetical protein BJ875DRAFT_486568 [Amylocarpus encephaloides]|uniref:Uncharacterized protein n=1 Tax=Amylocarpus encephaloides TaxID=45428 RepID=A0A9P7YDZ6_9HELO|nr:hypothetical protein BJ875DRAFT_486568 [Amylocarpus encephaloides]